MTLKEGKGDDDDTLRKKLVYVYDTAKFPFYRAEVYHQVCLVWDLRFASLYLVVQC